MFASLHKGACTVTTTLSFTLCCGVLWRGLMCFGVQARLHAPAPGADGCTAASLRWDGNCDRSRRHEEPQRWNPPAIEAGPSLCCAVLRCAVLSTFSFLLSTSLLACPDHIIIMILSVHRRLVAVSR